MKLTLEKANWLLADAALLNQEATVFLYDCYNSNDYRDIDGITDLLIDAEMGEVLDVRAEITIDAQKMSQLLLLVMRSASQARDLQAAGKAGALLWHINKLEEQIRKNK